MNKYTPFEWIMALRFLKEGRFQTALTIVGAGVGVAVIVFMSALLAGVQTNIFNRVLASQSHIVISPPDEIARPLRSGDPGLELAKVQQPTQRLQSIDQWQSIRSQLLLRSDVIAVSASASGAGFAVRGDASKTVSMIGVDPADYFQIVDIPSKITVGSSRLVTGDILIGIQLAIDLGVSVGDKLRIRTTTTTAQGNSSNEASFVINGLFDLGNRGGNESTVLVPLRAAQSLLGLPGGVTKIDINLADAYQAEVVAAELRAGMGVKAQSWIETFAQMFTALNSQNIANFVIRFFVALAVALGIASVLVVSVVQRSREIGILRAMGASRVQVLRVFLVQGAVVGLISSIAGSATGAAFVVLWRALARNADGTEFFPIALPISLFVLTGVVATLTGILAALMPAISAARLNPVDAIRG